jgi:DNA repair exonuclease SbcCD ATPase subunit
MFASEMIWAFGVAAAGIGGLIYLAWLVRGQRDRGPEWDAARTGCFRQAEQIQERAARIGQDLDEKYHQAGEPYAGLYRQARAALELAQAFARQVLEDRNRKPAQELSECAWWGVFLVKPLFNEYRQRQEWQRLTRQLPARLQAGQRAFDQLAQVQREIGDLGPRIKRHIQTLLEQAGAVRAQAEAEASPVNLLTEELRQIDTTSQQLQSALDELLSTEPPREAEVMRAHTIHLQAQEAIAAVGRRLTELAARRQLAGQAHEALAGGLQALTRAWQAEEQAGRPVSGLGLLLEAFQLRRERAGQALAVGDYAQVLAESGELVSQLAEQQAFISQLAVERRRVLAGHEQVSKEIAYLPQEMAAIPEFYQLDLTGPLYVALETRLEALQVLARSENLIELKAVELPDQAQVLAAWQKFQADRQAFEDRYQWLDERSDDVVERAAQACENLAGRQARYLIGIELEGLNADQDGLLTAWQALDETIRPGIRESALPGLIRQLQGLEQMLARLEGACDLAESKWALLTKERAQAQQEVKHTDWAALTRLLQQVADQGDANLAPASAACLESWQTHSREFEERGADFAGLARQLSSLRSEAEQLVRQYRLQLAKAGDQQRKLSDELNRLKADLREIQSAAGPGISNLESQILEIETWLKGAADLSKEALGELGRHNQDGVNLRATARQARDQAVSQRKRFEEALSQAHQAVEEAREALNAARQAVQNSSWSNRTLNQNQLWQGQDLLSKAEKQYKRFIAAPQEFTLERAIQELEENIGAPAVKARRQAEEVSARLRNQTAALQQLRRELDQALQRGNSLRSEMDTQTRNHWQTLQWDLSELEGRVQAATNYEEAHRLLSEAVQRVLKVLAVFESQVYVR